MQIIRQSAFIATPWKNGGGITHEVMRVPAQGDTFRWRVSVADIDAPGPFSNFAGHHRMMVLLRGAGVRLRFAGREPIDLGAIGDFAEFDGGLATSCELLGGPCTDLNLMVAKSLPKAQAQVLRIAGPLHLASDGGVTLIFAISGCVSLDAGHGPESLGPWDFAVAPPPDRVTITPAPPEPDAPVPAPPLVFVATVKDDSPQASS
jgi:environmental stress-induced protein Ves